jgi:hypothetical protein
MAEFLETRIADTGKLAELAEHALEHEFNRQLTHQATAALDPDGYHVLTVFVPDHTRMRLPSDAGKPADPTHHRARVLMKFQSGEKPVEAWLDVTDEDWNALTPAAQATL